MAPNTEIKSCVETKISDKPSYHILTHSPFGFFYKDWFQQNFLPLTPVLVVGHSLKVNTYVTIYKHEGIWTIILNVLASFACTVTSNSKNGKGAMKDTIVLYILWKVNIINRIKLWTYNWYFFAEQRTASAVCHEHQSICNKEDHSSR